MSTELGRAGCRSSFLVVMNGRDAEGLTEVAANEMIGKLLEYWQEYIQ